MQFQNDTFVNCINNLEWYNWQQDCKKMYHILMIHVSLPVEICFLSTIVVDRELAKKVKYLHTYSDYYIIM